MAESRDEQIINTLLAQGKLTASQVASVQERNGERKGNLVMALIQQGYITTNDLAAAAETLQPTPPPAEPASPLEEAVVPMEPQEKGGGRAAPRTLRPHRASLSSYQVDPEALRDVPKVLAEEYRVLPLQISEDRILVAMADQNDVFAIDTIRARTRRRVETIEVDETELMNAIDRFYVAHAQSQASPTAPTKDLDSNVSGLEDLGVGVDRGLLDMLDQGHVVEIVRAILRDAIRLKASDVHIEPRGDHVQIRYRIDGRLVTHTTLPSDMLRFVVSRIKILAECDISETRVPQDGRFATAVDGRAIDLRVSTLPTFWGEKVVLRLLDRSNTLVSLSQLGFSPETLRDYERLIRSPQGMLLVTGPTGSGKSTTLYASLHAINDETRNITTVEDPIEYEVEGLNQTQVHPRIDLTFSRALRHILRQDPDVILVGEIRDLETAEMAFRAALTGHLVLSTLHTNDAPSAATRLIDTGVAPYILASSLIGVLGQRLVRRICPHCRETCTPTPLELERLSMTPEQAKRIQFHKGRGCSRCRNTGYSGRIALYELMVMNHDLRVAIAAGQDASVLRQIALRSGMKSLRHDGIVKVHQGITSAQEVIGITVAEDL
ncbi:GspE/PulE family protein [bacterium]|nr:GspE/PulE family protein [bacterium]